MEAEKAKYTLPDGSAIEVGASRFRAPEILFRPDLIGDECEGIHQVLAFSIQKSDLDLRKVLYSNIVLSGGSTLFKGFGDRLLSEVKRLAPKDIKIRMAAPQERLYSTWIGGSILASLSTFQQVARFKSRARGFVTFMFSLTIVASSVKLVRFVGVLPYELFAPLLKACLFDHRKYSIRGYD